MKRLRWVVVLGLASAFMAAPALALEIGDPAPALTIKHWVKGGPVDLQKGKDKNVYVLEFLTIKSSPCVLSLKQLTKLQNKLKDKGVVIIGVSQDEKGKVETLAGNWGDNLGIVVGVDDESKTAKAYMGGVKVQEVPYVFIVDKTGALAWHGDPKGLEERLEQILAGKYDAKTKADEQKLIDGMKKYFKLVAQGGDENLKKARKLAKKIVKRGGKNAMLMNEFAWLILTEPRLPYRDLKVAMKAAERAYKACEGKEAAVVDTYARALWDTGKKAEAIKFQRKAVELCNDPKVATELKETLKRYEAEIPDEEAGTEQGKGDAEEGGEDTEEES
ncbi:MAG: redoxin family protein [Phycisphaerae bacterium]|nr:redoxin family protein [Phycisphaerae bacterium]